MNFSTYTNYFQEILNAEHPIAPYNNPDYFNYTKLNWSRMNRWLKHGELLPEAKEAINDVTSLLSCPVRSRDRPETSERDVHWPG